VLDTPKETALMKDDVWDREAPLSEEELDSLSWDDAEEAVDALDTDLSREELEWLHQHPEDLSPFDIERMRRATARMLAKAEEAERERTIWQASRDAKVQEDTRVAQLLPAFQAAGATEGACRAFVRLHPDVERPHGKHIVNWLTSVGLLT
jgi:lipase chaperone LimK